MFRNNYFHKFALTLFHFNNELLTIRCDLNIFLF